MKILSLLPLLLLPVLVQAAEVSGVTRSAGKIATDTHQSLSNKLEQSRFLTTGDKAKTRLQADLTSSLRYRTESLNNLVEFEIFDPWVRLTGDLDSDGYFHRLKVTFDADTSATTETVYAKIYLSHEGRDWYQVAESELYEIHANSPDDTYEILAELIEGYQPGYYEVLIELHSLYHPDIVASRIVSVDEDGYGIALEDLEHDERYRETTTTYYETEVYGGGSISLMGMLMLAGLVFIKLRYFSIRKK